MGGGPPRGGPPGPGPPEEGACLLPPPPPPPPAFVPSDGRESLSPKEPLCRRPSSLAFAGNPLPVLLPPLPPKFPGGPRP